MDSKVFERLSAQSSPLIAVVDKFISELEEPTATVLASCSALSELTVERKWLSYICAFAVARGIMFDLTISGEELKVFRDVAVYAELITPILNLTMLRDFVIQKDSELRDSDMEAALLQGLAQYDLQCGTQYFSKAKELLIDLATKAITLDGPMQRSHKEWLKLYVKSLDDTAKAGIERLGGAALAGAPVDEKIAPPNSTVLLPKGSYASAADKEIELAVSIRQLNELIGLDRAKAEVSQLIDFLKIQKLRKLQGLIQMETSRHLIFYGNPGTGKTTMARLLARIFYCLGVVSKGHLVEADRSTLVAGYLGQTAIRVRKVIEEARGGILFIDEAYSLTCDGANDSFGQEAVATLVKLMEDYRDDLIVIVAGYPDRMGEFIQANPGLRSRFNKNIFFEDYSSTEMEEIFGALCEKSVESSDKVVEDAEPFEIDALRDRCGGYSMAP